jgi:ribosomal protein L11 methyltransferase
MTSPTTVARLTADESTAKRIAAVIGETLPPEDTACAAFEDEAGRWHVSVHFREPPDEDTVRELVALAGGEEAARALRFETLAATDWVRESLAGLAPVAAGRFVVHGAHDRARVAVNRIGIEIEAALAFGTGHHGTTRGCLLALDGLAKKRRGARMRVLDVGTGTGVLAIAAARALNARVLATDIDARAVVSARENVRLNRAASRVDLVCAGGVGKRAVTGRAPFDLIFANILLGPLRAMARPIAQLAAPGAHVVLSGLLRSHAGAALNAYRAQGLVLTRRIPLDEWMTLVLRKP